MTIIPITNRFFLIAAQAGFLACVMHAQETQSTSLFDGKSLEGWRQINGKAVYTVGDGAIVGRTVEGSPNSFLCTTKEFGDFELEFEVKVDDQLNSGVQIRSRSMTEDDFKGFSAKVIKNKFFGGIGRLFGPQVEVEASPGKSGYIYGEATGLGWLSREQTHNHFKNGEWNRYRIVAKGANIKTWINETPVENLTHEDIYKTHPKGVIGLQVHSIKKGEGPFQAAWRNIRIREIADER